IKILDCTVRDGGLMNNHNFDDSFVMAVYNTCLAAGVDYMEFGYKADKKIFSPADYGRWKFCDEDDIKRIIGGEKNKMKLCVMADAERTDYHHDILPKSKSVFDCVRVATYIHQIPTALDMVKDAADKGYETTLNLMSISVVKDSDLNKALDVIAKSDVGTIYIVDSFGSMYSEQVRDLCRKFSSAMKGTGKQIGIHTHNNQQLAYANTIEAIINGVNRLDATIDGLGRGAGNCPLELLIGFLKNPKYDIRPVLECIQNVFLPLRKKIEWGFTIPYMITGQLNEHPRDAIKLRASDNPDDYIAFYDKMIE
ncbi:MAG TPA: nucleoid-structuring protein H-NS, partial [Elusimicrobia bacterium]|nr:nucleoid-structuring protein H-NS [Elusimicrobiota bacterium]